MINTGICSYGMSGKLFHAPFIEAHPGFRLLAITERHRNESVQKYPHARLYRSVEEMLADDELQLVIVNTPIQTHFDYARKALQAGKHVVVEKPFTITVSEGQELEKLAAEKKLLLSVYQNRRYDGDFRAVKEVLEQRLLGDIKEVEIRFDRYRPEPSGKLHKESSLPGAGTLYDLGSHLIDQALQLFGLPQALFADIWAMRPGGEADDYFELLLYYAGFRVRLKASSMVRETYYGYILHGSKGSFLQQRSDLQEEQLLAGSKPSIDPWCKPKDGADGLLHTQIGEGTLRKATFSTPGNYMDYYNEILSALEQGTPNPVPAAQSIQVIQIIQLAQESAREGRRISIN